ncbi:MAG: ABC transporter permease [Firmicutes bacterium]|nr:ABC transporter permease [Bacillota bacterium]MCL5038278.1 ABC transporter permease [Bacillota bacterium]
MRGNQLSSQAPLSPQEEPVFSFARVFWRRFRRNRLAVLGASILIILFAIAILAPQLAPYDPLRITLAKRFSPPGSPGVDGKVYVLGTDSYGRDLLSRMIYGARISLSVGFVSVGIAVSLGIILGSLSGYYGGIVDTVIMRLTDMMLSIPVLFLIITVLAFLGSGGFDRIYLIMGIIGVTSWPGVARLVRAEFLSLRERDFTEAARALGAPDPLIIFRHILPNAMAPIIVSSTLRVAGSILTEASLSFLGIGVQPPTPSWGNMLYENQAFLRNAAWAATFPGLAIFVTLLSFYLVGDGLRDALDPRLKE